MEYLTPEEYKQCIEIGIDGCNQVYEIQKKLYKTNSLQVVRNNE